jgi:uncharacterized membrane protein
MLQSEWSFYLALLFMALATYATRLAGYWLLRGRVIAGRARAAMEAVPPAILTAVIAPIVFLQGYAEMIAGAATLLAAVLRLPLLMVIAVGVVSVAVLRLYV